MTILRAVGRLLRLGPDLRENTDAGLEITLRNILDQLMAQVVGGIENFIQDRFRTALKMHDLAAAIFRGAAALDPAVILQTVEQSRQGWSLDSHSLGDFFLGELISALGKMNERSPFALAQTERAQALIELRAPGARGAEKHQT